jgi:hypothetical protein
VTVQDVDSQTFYAVGTGLFEKAGRLYDAFNVNVSILGATGSMAGTDDAGKAWATSYDERVREVLGAVNDLTKALENYGGVVMQAGYHHAVAEHNATPGDPGPAPALPPQPASTAGVLSAPPSAGGPGRGLVDAIGLMQQVGVPVPDGDTDKVSTAADAWRPPGDRLKYDEDERQNGEVRVDYGVADIRRCGDGGPRNVRTAEHQKKAAMITIELAATLNTSWYEARMTRSWIEASRCRRAVEPSVSRSTNS